MTRQACNTALSLEKPQQPENILMADRNSDQVRICDFGNAIELTPGDAHYCKYGTPEFIAPEVVNQTPVSKATDIW